MGSPRSAAWVQGSPVKPSVSNFSGGVKDSAQAGRRRRPPFGPRTSEGVVAGAALKSRVGFVLKGCMATANASAGPSSSA